LVLFGWCVPGRGFLFLKIGVVRLVRSWQGHFFLKNWCCSAGAFLAGAFLGGKCVLFGWGVPGRGIFPGFLNVEPDFWTCPLKEKR